MKVRKYKEDRSFVEQLQHRWEWEANISNKSKTNHKVEQIIHHNPNVALSLQTLIHRFLDNMKRSGRRRWEIERGVGIRGLQPSITLLITCIDRRPLRNRTYRIWKFSEYTIQIMKSNSNQLVTISGRFARYF